MSRPTKYERYYYEESDKIYRVFQDDEENEKFGIHESNLYEYLELNYKEELLENYITDQYYDEENYFVIEFDLERFWDDTDSIEQIKILFEINNVNY